MHFKSYHESTFGTNYRWRKIHYLHIFNQSPIITSPMQQKELKRRVIHDIYDGQNYSWFLLRNGQCLPTCVHCELCTLISLMVVKIVDYKGKKSMHIILFILDLHIITYIKYLHFHRNSVHFYILCMPVSTAVAVCGCHWWHFFVVGHRRIDQDLTNRS